MAKKSAPKLTAKQQLFINEYLIDLNATQAAIRAGYSKKTAKQMGTENLSKPIIAEEITKAFNRRARATGLTADYVLTSLKSVAERCMAAEEVVDNNGEPTGEFKFDSSGANKSLELLGRHLKLFTDKVDLTADLRTKVTVINMTGKKKK